MAAARTSVRRPGATLPLSVKLPLLVVGQLALFTALLLALAWNLLTRTAETAAAERLRSAVAEVGATARESTAARRERETRVAGDPSVRAAVRDGSASPRAMAELETLLLAGGLPVELYDADGRLIARAGGERWYDVDPPLTTDAATPFAASPFFGTGDRVNAWSVATVLDADDTVIGRIASLMRISSPPDALDRLRGLTGEQVAMYIRNEDGGLWLGARTGIVPPPERVVERDGVLYLERPAGRTIAAESPIEGTPWLVVMETPVAAVRATVRRTIGTLGLASLVLLLIVTAVTWSIARQLTRPLDAIASGAARISGGDYSARVDVGGSDEVGRLATSFNEMAEELEQSRRELIRRMVEAQSARLDAERAREQAEEARATAEAASRAKGDFLAVMSHELRTPLNAISGFTELLDLGIHGPVTDAQRDALRRIAHNQAHLLRLINDVLSYAKLDAGRVSYAISDIAIADALSDVEMLIGPQVVANGITLELEPCPADVLVRADGDKLQQILLNLVTNAVKFTGDGGRITLACDADAQTVRVHVRDTGIGIEPQRLEAIFDPFFQADRALNRPADGVGLGLAISRDLARGMGGDLTVTSRPGRGSTFTLSLPAGPAAARQSA